MNPFQALDDKGNVQEEGKEIVQENEDELELETIPAVQLRCVLHIHNTGAVPHACCTMRDSLQILDREGPTMQVLVKHSVIKLVMICR